MNKQCLTSKNNENNTNNKVDKETYLKRLGLKQKVIIS